MTKSEVNKMKKAIEEMGPFECLIVKPLLPSFKGNFALEVKEIKKGDRGERLKFEQTLTQYKLIIAFCTVNKLGMLIEAAHSLPQYYIY